MAPLVTRIRAGMVIAMALHVGSATAGSAEEKGEKVRGAMMGALVADALCLGVHYEYTPSRALSASVSTMSTP
ncbi:hypothetical protein T484DRAFT_1778567 [Baffinella frigidus]|nr:hypothetical protein T484DRAFT_1778567 [Cryptophyta sp. CCMP2293]